MLSALHTESIVESIQPWDIGPRTRITLDRVLECWDGIRLRLKYQWRFKKGAEYFVLLVF